MRITSHHAGKMLMYAQSYTDTLIQTIIHTGTNTYTDTDTLTHTQAHTQTYYTDTNKKLRTRMLKNKKKIILKTVEFSVKADKVISKDGQLSEGNW
jgi:hypothetical protein